MPDLSAAPILFEGETIRAHEGEEDVAWVLFGGERPFTIDEAFPAEMGGALEAVANSGARALVVAGTTRVFCAGADLRLCPKLQDPVFGRRWLREQHAAFASLVEFELPTVAAVHAAAAGAGCNLAIGCDHTVAVPGARFSQAFIRIGLATDMGSLFALPRRIGPAAAREMMLSGREVEGEEALRMGLVDEIVADAELWDRAQEVAAERAKAPAGAYAAIKAGLDLSGGMGLHDALALEARLQMDQLASADFAEGSVAFLEKRAPRFGN